MPCRSLHSPRSNHEGQGSHMGQISMEKSQPTGSVLSGNQHSGGLRRLDGLISDLTSMGFSEQEIRIRTHELIKFKLLAYDGEDVEQPVDDDLIKITPSGFIHLRSLPQFVEYLSSIAL